MGGVGITNGLAVPDFRVLAGVRYAVGLPGKGGARDSDSDGIVDSRDRCPNEPEDYDGFQDDDGCPDKARVIVRKGKLVIFDKVQFASGSDHILPKSEQVVDELAHALHEHHEIKRVEIQGHTDNVGDSAYNLKLGQERSDSVKHALIKRGIAPARLSAKGYGESDPIAPNATPAGRAKNRRVDFVIVN